MKILLLFLLISCGDAEQSASMCYGKEEALAACMTDEMRNNNVTKEQAELTCSPYYQAEGCYYL